jgi:hypothetical protein
MLPKITTEKLIEMINDEHSRYPGIGDQHYLLQGSHMLDGKLIQKKKSYGVKGTTRSLRLRNLVITGSLHIRDFTGDFLEITECNILEGVYLQYCISDSFIITNCDLDNLDLGLECVGERCHIQRCTVQKSIDLAGLDLSEKLCINEVTYKIVELSNNVGRIKVPEVHTENNVIARQFERLRIPIISSTNAVREEALALA